MFWQTKKSEKEDEQMAADLAKMTDELADRRVLVGFLRLCLVINTLIWVAVLAFPEWIFKGGGLALNLSDKLSVLILGIPLGAAMWATYCLLRLRYPDVEDNKDLQSDMMASYSYQASSTRRWYIWLFSIIVGVLNVGALVLVDLYLVS